MALKNMSVKMSKKQIRSQTASVRVSSAQRARGGRPAQISRDCILAEARLVPAEELTMPRIASRLGVNAAALYYHFESRDALLAELGSLVVSEFRARPADSEPWRDWLERTTLEVSRFLLANPVILEVENWSRVAKITAPMLESVLGILDEAGFGASEALQIWSVLANIAYAQARLLHDASRLDAKKRQQADEQYRIYAQHFPRIRAAVTRLGPNDPKQAFAETVRWLIALLPDPVSSTTTRGRRRSQLKKSGIAPAS